MKKTKPKKKFDWLAYHKAKKIGMKPEEEVTILASLKSGEFQIEVPLVLAQTRQRQLPGLSE